MITFLSIITSCDNQDWVLYRTSQDYLPFKNGNWWSYQSQDVTELIQVTTDTVVNNQPAIHQLNNFADEYWFKNNGEYRKLIVRTVNYNGDDYTIQNAWLLQYKTPFVLGNSWSDIFTDTVYVLGDTYRLKHIITRQVVEINDINTPAGTFFQTYKIIFSETFVLNDSTEYYAGYECFAPNVGLVKKVSNNIESVLIDYLVK